MTITTYYIHNKYIATGGWQETTWNWLMGQIGKNGWTLVNVVGEIWNVGVNTISKVKSVATDVWNGVKNGFNFIADFVISVIHGTIVEVTKQAIFSLLKTISTLWGKFDVELVGNSIEVKNQGALIFNINLTYDDESITLIYNNMRINFGSPLGFTNTPIQFETLSLLPPASNFLLLLNWLSVFLAMTLTLSNTPITDPASWLGVNTAMLLITYGGYLLEKKIYEGELNIVEKENLLDRMSALHIGAGISLIASTIKRTYPQVTRTWRSSSSNYFQDLIRTNDGSLNAIGLLISSLDIALFSSIVGATLLKIDEGYNFLQAATDGWNLAAGFSNGFEPGMDVLYTIGFGGLGGLFGAFPQIGANIFNDNSIEKINKRTNNPTQSKFRLVSPTFFVIGLIHLVSGLYYSNWKAVTFS